MKPPPDCLRVTVWAAWVIGADNRDGRNERLSRVPEILRAAVRARPQVVAELYCVGRANFPPRGGNVGLQWHVVGVADVPYRTCVPKNGELLFVLAASQSAGGKP